MHIATALQFEKGPRKVIKRAWERPPFMVAKRNARERTRVHAVNQAFGALKFHLPTIRSNAKRVSKLKILRAAINYIATLTDLLHGNADVPKLSASNCYFESAMNMPPGCKRDNEASSESNAMTRDETQQRQQHNNIRQNSCDTAQCYNKQYWLPGHSVLN
ncbi:unnamed protein product [Litomosoides sigmodontis]|uniref:BHLH domain-containing protein n=1 Tax=Litomosoides sigmodontis TaxID=42156 RepID=A0A3P6TUJ6_LITSI|nr:unnamed protein product [Litomosoides sigmodontis]